MRKTFLESSVKILVDGKNINNYIKRLINDRIEIFDLKYLNYSKAEVIIKYSDYLKLKDIRSIYKIKIIDKYGNLKFGNKVGFAMSIICFMNVCANRGR